MLMWDVVLQGQRGASCHQMLHISECIAFLGVLPVVSFVECARAEDQRTFHIRKNRTLAPGAAGVCDCLECRLLLQYLDGGGGGAHTSFPTHSSDRPNLMTSLRAMFAYSHKQVPISRPRPRAAEAGACFSSFQHISVQVAWEAECMSGRRYERHEVREARGMRAVQHIEEDVCMGGYMRWMDARKGGCLIVGTRVTSWSSMDSTN